MQHANEARHFRTMAAPSHWAKSRFPAMPRGACAITLHKTEGFDGLVQKKTNPDQKEGSMNLEIGPKMAEIETEFDWPFEITSEGHLICFTHADPIVYTGLSPMHWRYLLTKASEELVKCSHGGMN